jgi:hypothetical protein
MSLDEARSIYRNDAPQNPGGLPPNTNYLLVGDNDYNYSSRGTDLINGVVGDWDTYFIKVDIGLSYSFVAVPFDHNELSGAAFSTWVALSNKNGNVENIKTRHRHDRHSRRSNYWFSVSLRCRPYLIPATPEVTSLVGLRCNLS